MQPPQPPEKDWRFINSLKAPLWSSIRFQKTNPDREEVSIRSGVSIQAIMPDSSGTLRTAYDDLDRFFDAAGISRSGPYPIVIRREPTACHEAYRVEIRESGCAIIANDTEGARRGIFFLQDEMLRTGGPCLPLGMTERRPQIRTRLSRCFFGPINRPPKRRDELADDVDYYPDEYLNRLAHDGVNGLWITINFWDLCPSKYFPTHGKDSPRRLEKLRRTVAKCARYGIKIYVFCIEPKGFGFTPDYLHPVEGLKRHPEFGGHQARNITYFCPSSPTAQAYLEEATYHLFSEVPALGGMLGIHLGERPTHCCSSFLWNFDPVNCPRCSKRELWQVFHDTLTPLWRGMHRANPEAELISWLYAPTMVDRSERSIQESEELIYKVAAHFPENVTFQYNFESMGTLDQLGKKRFVRDYSLAYVGPSHVFQACTETRIAQGGRVSAKLQVGCSHEVATVPFVPAPGNLFEKYRAMHELRVSGAMQSWYFGSYPSLMTKAAGELSFAPFPATEKAFLHRLAAIYWAEDAPTVANAWSLFSEAYRHFPANLAFAWYGPVHDAITWPLHLKPVDLPIARSWLIDSHSSGDRIGECVGFEHSLEEAILLCEKMHQKWSAGIRLLLPLLVKYRNSKERLLEIGVAQAMGLQIHSALNVLKFYAEREKFYLEAPLKSRQKSLEKLRKLVVSEIENSMALEKLARSDSRLGFHSEAEGYKYFPAKLRWRARLLRSLLQRDFPEMKCHLQAGSAIPSPSQPASEDAVYECIKVAGAPGKDDWKQVASCDLLSFDNNGSEDWQTSWQAVHDGCNLYFKIECGISSSAPAQQPSLDFGDSDHLHIAIEPRRFWPTLDFYIERFGTEYFDSKQVPLDRRWKSDVTRLKGTWSAMVTIPLQCLDASSSSSFRLNVERTSPDLGLLAWIPRKPGNYRLIFGDADPADFGWLRLQ